MKISIRQAYRQGYTVDDHVYPHFAYKGPRSAPSAWVEVYTEMEASLLSTVEYCLGVVSDVPPDQVDRDLLGALEAASDRWSTHT